MCTFVALALGLCSLLVGITDCISSYDQRQTGDLNVQIGLKNINIFALLKGGKEEYVDYDYAYDYSEMTIKPTNGTSTTAKPLNASNITTNETQHELNTTSLLLEQTTESIIKSSTTTALDVEAVMNNMNQTANNSVISTHSTVTDMPTTISPDYSNNANATVLPIGNKCRRGFVHNNQGKCEYKVHGTSNALRRIVKLAQKIKISREMGEREVK